VSGKCGGGEKGERGERAGGGRGEEGESRGNGGEERGGGTNGGKGLVVDGRRRLGVGNKREKSRGGGVGSVNKESPLERG